MFSDLKPTKPREAGRRRNSLALELGFPRESDIEKPLLRLIEEKGGRVRFSEAGEWIESRLADHFGLSQYAREYSDPRYRSKGQRVWRNTIQFVRNKCVKNGWIDASERDVWALTERGLKYLKTDS